MPTRPLAALLVLGTSTLAVACSGGGTTSPGPQLGATSTPVPTATPTATPVPTPTATPVPTLTVSPQSVPFTDLGQPTPSPQTVVLSGTAVTMGLPIAVSIADPTVVSVVPVVFAQAGPPTYAFYEIARGSTTVTFTAGTANATVTETSALCGRPDWLRPESQLIYPPPGSTGVPTTLGKLYFSIAVQSFTNGFPTTVYLNLIVGQHATQFVGTTLQPDTPPPGSASPAPLPNFRYQTMSVQVPLAPATSYRTQLYDDACQPAILTGAFTTA